MKNYYDYEKKPIGSSDIASLILVGCEIDGELKLQDLHFGADGSYSAYIVDENAEIGSHYKQVCEFYSWLRIYDDEGLQIKFASKNIKIYRAAEFGCIVQLIN